MPADKRSYSGTGQCPERAGEKDADQRSLIGLGHEDHWPEETDGKANEPSGERSDDRAYQNLHQQG